LRGEGQAGEHGGPSGDLYVEMHLKPHKIFEREGRDLYCEIPIGFSDAVLGGDLEVPTLEGKVKLKIPQETQTGKLFRLRGKGITQVNASARGDMLCRVLVETPVNLTKKQKDLMQEFKTIQEKEGNRQNPKKSNWFDGVKNFIDELRM
jgi:molecular chaperone DnaJ